MNLKAPLAALCATTALASGGCAGHQGLTLGFDNQPGLTTGSTERNGTVRVGINITPDGLARAVDAMLSATPRHHRERPGFSLLGDEANRGK